MQETENKPTFLRALPGGLSAVTIGVEAGRKAAEDADFAAQVSALTRLAQLAEPKVDLDHRIRVRGDAFSTALVVPRVGGPPAPLRRYRVRSLAPALAARDRRIALDIVSPADARRRLDAETLLPACQAVHASGCRRIAAVVADGDAGLDPIRAQLPQLMLVATEIESLLGALSRGESRHDAVIVPAAFAGIVAQVAAGLAGSAPATLCLDTDASSLRVSAGLQGGDGLASTPGLVLALASLLAEMGRREAAAKLSDALLLALEEGHTTADIEVSHPYPRVLDDDAFVDAVAARFGRRPRAVERLFVTSQAPAQSARPRMRVVG